MASKKSKKTQKFLLELLGNPLSEINKKYLEQNFNLVQCPFGKKEHDFYCTLAYRNRSVGSIHCLDILNYDKDNTIEGLTECFARMKLEKRARLGVRRKKARKRLENQ